MIFLCGCILLQPVIYIVTAEIHNRYFNRDNLRYREALKTMEKQKDEFENSKFRYEQALANLKLPVN